MHLPVLAEITAIRVENGRRVMVEPLRPLLEERGDNHHTELGGDGYQDGVLARFQESVDLMVKAGYGRIVMTSSEAAELQVRWKQQEHSYRCPHAAVDKECTENGLDTGNYRCRACGAVVDPPPKSYRLPST